MVAKIKLSGQLALARYRRLLSFRKTPNVIGFDLALEKLNMVQIDRSSGHSKIHAALSDYHDATYDDLLAEPERMKALIKRSFAKMPFVGRRIVSSMPISKLQLMFLNYPCKPGQTEEEALFAVLKYQLDADLNDFVVDYVPIKPTNQVQQQRMALVALVKRLDVENYLELLNKCGLEVVALEIGPIAIRRLITAMSHELDPKKILTINFGTQKSFLTVLWDGDILLDRELNFGLETIVQALGRALEIDYKTVLKMLHHYGLSASVDKETPENKLDEAAKQADESDFKEIINDILNPLFLQLANQIREVLIYIASETRGGAVELIYLMGSLARLRGGEKIIGKLISIPVVTLNPFYGFSVEENMKGFDDLGPLSGIAVATGLALHGIDKHA